MSEAELKSLYVWVAGFLVTVAFVFAVGHFFAMKKFVFAALFFPMFSEMVREIVLQFVEKRKQINNKHFKLGINWIFGSEVINFGLIVAVLFMFISPMEKENAPFDMCFCGNFFVSILVRYASDVNKERA